MIPRLFKILVLFVVLFNLALAFVFLYPLPKLLVDLRPQETLKILDRQGTVLSEILTHAQGRQTFLPLPQIPASLKNAFLAAEDQRFYENSGVDFSATLRAIWQNAIAGTVVSGGSTITQQLVRNLVGTGQPRSLTQKIKESVLALRLSRLHDKDRIFELYLNSIYFGGLAYGVEAASWQYFGKSAQNLDLAESASLAGLPQAPNRFYPFKHFEAAQKRQRAVLSAMVKADLITNTEYRQAVDETLRLQSSGAEKKAPHFVDFVLQNIPEALASSSKISTTLDSGLQERLENLIQAQLSFLKNHHLSNAAAVVLDAKNGDLLALVGSADYDDVSIQGAVNVATSLRQPGSALKPLLYAAAFERGWTPGTLIADEPVRFDTPEGLPYTPQNFDLDFHGPVSAAQALAQSLNIPAVKTLDFVGVPAFLKILKDFGLTTLTEDADHYGLSLALGSGEVSLLELTGSYAAFANEGRRCPIRFLSAGDPSAQAASLRLESFSGPTSPSADADPRLQASGEPSAPSARADSGVSDCPLVLQPQTARTVASILSNNELRLPSFGEENPLHLEFPVAAKTGTSRNFRDNWTVGFTDDFAVGVWVGNASGEAMQGVSGIEGAAPLFAKLMNLLHEESGTRLTIDSSITIPTLLSASDSTTSSFRIATPFDHDRFLLDPGKPADSQKIQFQASESAQWFVDGKLVGEGERVLWGLEPGTHEIRAVRGAQEDQITIEAQ